MLDFSLKNNSISVVPLQKIYAQIWYGLTANVNENLAFLIPNAACQWLRLFTELGRQQYYVIQPRFS